MKKVVFVIAFFFFLIQTQIGQAAHVSDEILIEWRVRPTDDVWQDTHRAITLTKIKEIGMGWELWRLPKGADAYLFLSQLRENDDLAACELNYIRHAFIRIPDDPELSKQNHLLVSHAYTGWDFEVGESSPTTIAVIDTGVDLTHPDIASKLWTNPRDLFGSGDEDQNGKLDDMNGFDFADEDNSPSDCVGHGTLVASIAAAATNNSIGIAGVNWKSKILPLKVFGDSGCSSAESADIVEAILYAILVTTSPTYSSYTGRTVINMSLGCRSDPANCPDSAIEKQAVNLALKNGILVFAAKGNFGDSVSVFPSDYPGVLGVGALNASGSLASFSSFGAGMDLVALGTDVFGASRGGGYRSDNGTSFSAPQAAAAAALIFSALPSATTTSVQDILLNSTDDLGASGRDDVFGLGRLNIYCALKQAKQNVACSSGETGALVESRNLGSLDQVIAAPTVFRRSANQNVVFRFKDAIIQDSSLSIEIYDLSGTLVRRLDQFAWDGKNSVGVFVAPAVYYFLAKTNQGASRGRVIVGAE